MKQFVFATVLALSTWSCTTPNSPDDAPPPVEKTLSGIVSDKAAPTQPLEGVRVVATVTVVGGRDTLSATTDANGFYRIAPLASSATLVSLQVSQTGYESYSRDLRLDGDTRVDVQLARRRTFTLFGVVSEMTSGGLTPVEGVWIEAFNCDAIVSNCQVYNDQSTTTDRNGAYRIPGLWSGQETALWVIRQGYQLEGAPPLKPCDGCSRLFIVSDDTQLDLQVVQR